MLFGDDVVDRKPQTPGRLRHTAIFARVRGALAHRPVHIPLDHRDMPGWLRSERSALSRMIASRLSMCR